jgi:hypothetical protein
MAAAVKDGELFASVLATQFRDYVAKLDAMRPEDYESYSYQMMVRASVLCGA